MTPGLEGRNAFLWADLPSQERFSRSARGISSRNWDRKRTGLRAEGLVHDWVGAAWIPGATVNESLSLSRTYDNHKQVYKPEVIDSKLLSHHGNDFKIYLRLLKKKIVTVVLVPITMCTILRSTHAWFCRSSHQRESRKWRSRKGERNVSPPIRATGYLWRLDSYWRFWGARWRLCTSSSGDFR